MILNKLKKFSVDVDIITEETQDRVNEVDDNRLDTLFLTMPVSWKGRIIQYVGRLHREHEDKKKVIVYDYLDNMKILEKMYNRRQKGYKIAGYEIIE